MNALDTPTSPGEGDENQIHSTAIPGWLPLKRTGRRHQPQGNPVTYTTLLGHVPEGES